MDDYERVLLVKPEVFMYKIPPRTTSRGYRASDWKLDQPDWTGRLRLVAKDKECILKLEDKTSGELFAKCPIDKYPGIAVEPVLDSSRYFVIRLKDDGDRTAFIGIGFADRGDSFDLNVALQDHFKWLQKSEELEQEAEQSINKPQLDLSLKEGQTITINMNIAKKSGGSGSSKARGTNKAPGTGLLPPPPGSTRTVAAAASTSPVASNSVSSPVKAPTATSNSELLLDLGSLSLDSTSSTTASAPVTDSWGEFTTAKPSSGDSESTARAQSQQQQQPANWVNF